MTCCSMTPMSNEPLQAADVDDYYDYSGEALKVDDLENDLGEDMTSESLPQAPVSDSIEPGTEGTAPGEDGTFIHSAEHLMDQQWDDDLR